MFIVDILKKIIFYLSHKLTLSYSETRSFLALLMICLVAIFVIIFSKRIIQSQDHVDLHEIKRLDSLVALFDNPAGITLFAFDPNALPVDSLKLLGFPVKIAERLDNYRSKGGEFFVKKDIKKIYGLNEEFYHGIEAYILLPDSLNRSMSENLNLDINKANVKSLSIIDGIEDRVANRIVRYRELLGGFINKNQLDEVYELEGAALINLKKQVYITSTFKPRKIKVNQATEEEMIRHPYISRQLAEDIVMFRDINGAIDSEKLLADFKSVDKSNFQKLILYLDFQ